MVAASWISAADLASSLRQQCSLAADSCSPLTSTPNVLRAPGPYSARTLGRVIGSVDACHCLNSAPRHSGLLTWSIAGGSYTTQAQCIRLSLPSHRSWHQAGCWLSAFTTRPPFVVYGVLKKGVTP